MIGIIGLDLYGSTLSLNLARNHEVQLFSPLHSSRVRKIIHGRSLNSDKLNICRTLPEFVETFHEDSSNVIITCINEEKNATKIVQQFATLLKKDDCILDFGKTIDLGAIQKRHLTCSMNGVGYMDCSVVSPLIDSIYNPSILCSGTSTIQSEELLTEMTDHTYFNGMVGASKYLHMVISSLEESFIQAIGDVYAYCNYEVPRLKAVLTKVQKDYPNSCRLIDHISHVLNIPKMTKVSPSLNANPILHPIVEESMRRGAPFSVQTAAHLNQSTSRQTRISNIISTNDAASNTASHTASKAANNTATKPDLKVAGNTLLFLTAMAILETRWLLRDTGYLDDRLKSFLDATNLSSDVLRYDDENLLSLCDATYNSAKKFLAHCVETDRAVPLVANAISQYASIQNPVKSSTLLVAARNYLYGDRVSYLQL